MRSTTVSALALIAALSNLADDASAQARQYINGRSAAQANATPFSGAVLAGNTLYLSGMLGLSQGQRPATAAEEARNVLNSIKGTLEQAGMTMDDLVTVQVFAADLGDYADFNAVYRTYFTKEFPARAFVGAGSLLNNARFEVVGVAVKQ
jgi:2-iminobutanoate/2-iminopropanoate deaminase